MSEVGGQVWRGGWQGVVLSVLLCALWLSTMPCAYAQESEGGGGQADRPAVPERSQPLDAAEAQAPPSQTSASGTLRGAPGGVGVPVSPLNPLTEIYEAREARRAIDQEFEGLPIGRVAFRCDLELCQRPLGVDRFRELSGLYVGQTYSPQAIERAERRLLKTGFFSAVTVERRRVGASVFVALEAQGAVLIRRVGFEGLNPPPFETELRKVLMYRPGQVFLESAERAQAQLASLAAIFEREGYYDTEVRMVVNPVEGERHLVDLVFEVARGQERSICEIGLRGVRGMTAARAQDLLLSDVSVLSRRVPLLLPTYTTETVRQGRDALIAEYRRLGYFRARVVDQQVEEYGDEGCVRLLFEMDEGPFWALSFEGSRLFDDATLTAQLPFFASGYVDADEIRAAESAIRQLYETRGYPFARVQGEESAEDRLNRALRFEIEEGPQVQINEVRIHGARAFSEAELLSEFGTQAFGIFDTAGFLQTDRLLADMSALEERMRAQGYLQALSPIFLLEVNDSGAGMRVRVEVRQGPQTLVDRVDLEGARALPAGTLEAMLSVKPQDPFVPVNVRADQSRISQYYGAIGYPLARVTTTCRLLTGEEVPCEAPQLPQTCRAMSFAELERGRCEWREGVNAALACERVERSPVCEFSGGVMAEAVRVQHTIEEGPRVRVGEVLLKGNFRTRSSVIYRELPLSTGDRFDVQKLIEGQGNMRQLGLFDSVSIETIGLENVDAGADEIEAALIISVEESRARFVEFSVGLEGRDLLGDSRRLLLTGEAQYTDNNLLGTGQRFRPRLISAVDTLELAQLARAAGAGETGERGLDYLFGAELIYSHPRFLKSQTGVDKLFLTITPFYLLDLLGVTNDQVLREEWGLRLELRKELEEIADRLYLTFGVEAKQAATWTANDPRIAGERIFSPRRATAKLLPEINFDRRDSPLNPRSGYYVEVKPELVSGDALSQDGEDLIGDSYLRLSAALSAFFSLDGRGDYVLGQGLRYGQIVPFAERQSLVPPDERFYLGGVGTVRGFPTNVLGPVGARQQPLGGELTMSYTAELRYPLIKEWSVYGATFFDAGLLVDCFDEAGRRSSAQCFANAFPDQAPLSRVRTSAGLGLRYVIFDQIPLLFDYGVVLDRRPGEGFGSLHFNLGYSF
ncbi:POTRA domain-containing protein [Lujinxingia sediminis]|uniref:POTRA domain-containing protein n=1 Tax=Lujinxingia sediminis TaxID=2480984 RepID=UPI0013E3A179|nr:outer membrane protein assembly factor [Lujinxingia sediminis]